MAHYTGHTSQDYAADLPSVQDPDKAFADILRQDYNDYIGNFRDFEKRLLDMTDDTTLMDRARENAATQTRIASEVQRRNQERYGMGMSAAQRQQQQRATQRGGQLALAGGVNNARLRQRTVNQALLSELVGIGQGINSQALAGLGSGAQNAVARRNAYKQAKTGYANNIIGMGTAILASMI